MAAVEPSVRKLAQGANFAALTVHLGSGAAMTHVMWVDADDDHVLINTEVHRAKFKAVERDPRVTVMIWVRDDPYTYAEVRGRVVETVVAPKHGPISMLSHRSTWGATTTPPTSSRSA